MSSTTTNLSLHKIDLTDAPPDITVLNPNWDKLDEEITNLAAEVSSAGIKIVAATSSNGVAYEGTANGVTALFAGLAVMFVPNMTSTNTTPTFNLNGLGAKNIRRKLSVGTATTAISGYKSWLYTGKPYLMVYDGTQWVTADLTKPCGDDIYGTVPIKSGGTGASDAPTARTNLEVYSKDEINNLFANAQITIDNVVTENGTNPVTSAAIVAYVADQIAKITDFEEVEF